MEFENGEFGTRNEMLEPDNGESETGNELLELENAQVTCEHPSGKSQQSSGCSWTAQGLNLSSWHIFHEKQSFGERQKQEGDTQTSPHGDGDSWELLPGILFLPDGAAPSGGPAALPKPFQQIPSPGAELPWKFWTLSLSGAQVNPCLDFLGLNS